MVKKIVFRSNNASLINFIFINLNINNKINKPAAKKRLSRNKGRSMENDSINKTANVITRYKLTDKTLNIGFSLIYNSNLIKSKNVHVLKID